MELFKQIKTAVSLLLLFTLLTGLIYPALVTLIAQQFFPFQANGSLMKNANKLIGSQLIGQAFTQSTYFWGRPSATIPFPYNAENSMGSNFAPTNPEFLALVKNRVDLLKKSSLHTSDKVPVDLVTASGSGLDPEISPTAALYQVSRIAKARKLPEQKIVLLIQKLTKMRELNLLGEPRVNVLQLNLALDTL